MRYLGTAIRHRSRSPARGLVCQPSGSEPGGPASWTSATDTPCRTTTELRCCQDAGPLRMFQEATVSMAAFSQTAACPRSGAPVRHDDLPGIAAYRAGTADGASAHMANRLAPRGGTWARVPCSGGATARQAVRSTLTEGPAAASASLGARRLPGHLDPVA